MRPFLLLALALLLTPLLPAAELVWPGLLGPQRDGWVEHFKVPVRWPKQLKKEWSVEVGTGYGTPLVAGQRVYQHARQGEEEVVWCFDLASGKRIWRKSYKNPFKIGGGGERHGKGPKSCPVLADGRLFTLSITGMIHAWDAEDSSDSWYDVVIVTLAGDNAVVRPIARQDTPIPMSKQVSLNDTQWRLLTV